MESDVITEFFGASAGFSLAICDYLMRTIALIYFEQWRLEGHPGIPGWIWFCTVHGPNLLVPFISARILPAIFYTLHVS